MPPLNHLGTFMKDSVKKMKDSIQDEYTRMLDIKDSVKDMKDSI